MDILFTWKLPFSRSWGSRCDLPRAHGNAFGARSCPRTAGGIWGKKTLTFWGLVLSLQEQHWMPIPSYPYIFFFFTNTTCHGLGLEGAVCTRCWDLLLGVATSGSFGFWNESFVPERASYLMKMMRTLSLGEVQRCTRNNLIREADKFRWCHGWLNPCDHTGLVLAKTIEGCKNTFCRSASVPDVMISKDVLDEQKPFWVQVHAGTFFPAQRQTVASDCRLPKPASWQLSQAHVWSSAGMQQTANMQVWVHYGKL